MNIALFGGSFNPVHKEHVNIVKSAISSLSLDKVIVIPSNITPLKQYRNVASADDRLNMCKIAFADADKVEISDYEIKQGGVSYSYLTCREFKNAYPNDKLYFILGADMLETFHLWKYPDEILKCVTLAVCGRENQLDNLPYGAVNFGYIGAKISSTRVRVLCSLGEDVSEYVGEKEANYIKENGIYRIDGLHRVKDMLTPERWEHTIRVAQMAAENCARFCIPEKTAITASALHDCAKYLTLDSPALKDFKCPDGVPKPIIHQYAGAYIAERDFGISDEGILNSIRYHTSGRDNMSDLEKLIYLSDLLEEGRSFEGVERLRKLFYKNMDEALYESVKFQLAYLKEIGAEIYPLTIKTYEFLKEHKNEQ